MNIEHMYDLAFKFKSTEIWKYVYEDELFAVKLSDDRIAFCSIMGSTGQHIALALYIGAEGFESFRMLHDRSSTAPHADMLQNLDTMQLSLESAEFVSPDERKMVQSYAQKHNLSLSGSFAYPHFVRYRPHCLPWLIDQESDWTAMEESLRTVLAISDDLKALNADGLSLKSVIGDGQPIPLFWLEGDDVQIGKTTIPAPVERQYPEALPIDEFTLAMLKKKPMTGILQCEVKYLPDPIQSDTDGPSYYPAMLVTVEKKKGLFRQTGIIEGPDASPDALLKELVNHLVSFDHCPRAIEVRTEQTAAVLRGFCSSVGIQMKTVKVLPDLDQAWKSVTQGMKGNDYGNINSDMLEMLAALPDNELANLPPAIRDQLKGMADRGQLPNELERKLNGTVVKMVPKVGPNDPCPCGSGKKYKKCCGR